MHEFKGCRERSVLENSVSRCHVTTFHAVLGMAKHGDVLETTSQKYSCVHVPSNKHAYSDTRI